MNNEERTHRTVERIAKALLDGATVNYAVNDDSVSQTMSDAIEHFYATHSEVEIKESDDAARQVFHGNSEPFIKYLKKIALDFAVYIVDDVIEYEDQQKKEC